MQYESINQTNKPITVYYPAGGGGKFLMACLSLADNAIFPDFRTVHKQLNQGLTQLEKFNTLMYRLDDAHKAWNDFLLTPSQFDLGFNVHQHSYNLSVLDLLDKIIDKDPIVENFLEPDSIVDLIIDKEKFYFFTTTHSICHLYFYSKYWKNGSIIYFNNSGVFIKHFRKNYIEKSINKNDNYSLFRYLMAIKRKYNSLSGKNWPEFKLVLKNNTIFDTKIKNEIKNNFPDLYKDLIQMKYYVDFYKNMSRKLLSNKVVTWNTNNFFDKQSTLSGIETLYTELNLTNYNKKLIEKLYDRWIFCLHSLKKDIDYNHNICKNKKKLIEKIKKYKEKNDFRNASVYVQKLKDILK
jgi:hypothetical protein